MLRVEGLSKKLGDFEVKNVGFDVERRDYFVLLGASGVGKTVLLEAITGITLPDDGRILLAGRDITREPIQRRNIGLVFQDQALFPHMTVGQNIAYGLRSRGAGRGRSGERVAEIARDLEITPLLGRRPGTLSGGEAQRVALARALATDPACLLLDEPLSSLDVGARSGMRALLRRLNRDGLTMVHVTHDYEEAISLATRIGIMERGTIVQTGRPDEVFRRPTSEFVARFVGIRNFFPGVLVTGDEPVFCFSGLSLSLLTDAGEGEGYIIIGSEDVVISLGRPKTSARNMFTGIIEDIFPVRVGIEVIVDIGVDVAALVTRQSVEALGLEVGKEVWVSVKASAVRFVEA
jgi:molybdate/tungstate transport system ATP-binding protein